MLKPLFTKRVEKLQQILIQEMMDGCVDCIECGGLCPTHLEEAKELFIHPKETIGMDNQGRLPKPEIK